MDAVTVARDYLLDRVGHLTYPGEATYDAARQLWRVAVWCRSETGAVSVGDLEIDSLGQVVHAPSREEMLSRLPVTTSGVGYRR
jgi:hypothetical protein